jgi:hypothetical protein
MIVNQATHSLYRAMKSAQQKKAAGVALGVLEEIYPPLKGEKAA